MITPGPSEAFGDRPNSIPWPPIIYAAAILGAVAMRRLYPASLPFVGAELWRVPGILIILLGLGLDSAAMLEMRRRKANILPHRAATALVTTGVFALSRNPIYLDNTVAVAGAALAFDSAWFLVAAALAALAIERLAIRPEEAHLAAKFGEVWPAYIARTNRWIGRR